MEGSSASSSPRPLIAATSPTAANNNTELIRQLRERLESQLAGIPLTVNGRPLRAVPALQDLYARRIYEPLWFHDGKLLSAARAIPAFLASAQQDGLRPEDYGYTTLDHAIAAYDEGRLALAPADLELLLTDSVLSYASDMLRGRVRPDTSYPDWETAPRDFDLTKYLQDALDAGSMVSSLRNLAPHDPHYHRLRKLLARYRQVERDGGFSIVPPGEVLKPGMRTGRVSALRLRLVQSGDWIGPQLPPDPELFDAGLEAAVIRYQTRQGLEPDGIVGATTIESLGITAAQRILTIELNMERWRWLPQDLGDHYITVNIAAFQMQLVEQGETRLAMPVVVGKRYHATPVFTGLLTYLVFGPYWNVPQSIAVNEILPQLKRNPGYLEQESMEVFRGWDQPEVPLDPSSIDWSGVTTSNFPYRFRQKPGPQNALGQIKFMFPNKYNVYMHDTPAKALFSSASRDFSHGCIRLKEPMQLAQYLLRGQSGWDEQSVVEAARRATEQTVRLQQSWPVYVLYWTAWVGPEGGINFRKDVYGRDRLLAKSLYH
ncbi:MAG: L,D-transpeptidase family protein [Arenicellales bacterium]